MSRAPHLSITVLVVNLLVAIAAVQQAAGQPHSEQELAARYKEIIGELETIPIDSAELLESAETLSRKLDVDANEMKLRFKNIKAGRVAGAAAPASIEEGFERFVVKEDLIPLVQSLGEISLRIHAAQHWTEVVLRGERKDFWDARVEVRARNLAEVERASRDYHAALLTRHEAMQSLAALFSGRAKVVARLSSPGGGLVGERDATPQEAIDYVRGLHATATSRIFVLPPQFIKTKDIFSIEARKKLEKQQKPLNTLSAQVDGELKRLKVIHTEQIKQVLEAEDGENNSHQLRAIVSLGFWNSDLGPKTIREALDSNDETMRDAGIIALRRLQLSPKSMREQWVKHPNENVRVTIARLASEEIHMQKEALLVLLPLFSDQSQTVRKEAYAAVDRLQISQLADQVVLDSVKPALTSQQPPLVCDAIEWMTNYGDNRNMNLVAKKQDLLTPLSQHKVDQIRTAASNALSSIHGLGPVAPAAAGF